MKKVFTGFICFIIVFALLLSRISSCADAGYEATWADNEIHVEKGSAGEAHGLTPYIHANRYGKDWYANDRKRFASLLGRAKRGEDIRKALYEDYISYVKDFNFLYDSSYKSKRGFTLYPPEITEKLNMAFVSLYARKNLLTDMDKKEIKDLESYYPADKKYAFMDYDSFIVTDAATSGRSPFTITPTDKFDYYDQNGIIDLIEKLPINDYFLYGTAIMFVNGRPNGGVAGHNYTLSTRGFSGSKIFLFNRANSKNNLEFTIMHEIGHNIGKEVFKRYPDDSFDNAAVDYAAQKEYTGIYGQKVKENAEWKDDIDENFAEDFAQIYCGGKKQTTWQGDHKDEVRAFIEKELGRIEYDKIPVAKGLRIATSDADIPNVSFKPFSQDYYMTKDKNILLTVDGLRSAGLDIGAYVYTDEWSKLYRLNGDQCAITLPYENQEYTIVIGVVKKISETSNYIQSNIGSLKIYYTGLD